MSDIIRIPYEELYQRAARIRQQAELVRTEVRTLSQTVESVEWMGRRAENFFKMWNDARPEMENWALILERFADDLESQARRIQAVEEGL